MPRYLWQASYTPEGVKGVGKYYKDRYRLARFGREAKLRLHSRWRVHTFSGSPTHADTHMPGKAARSS